MLPRTILAGAFCVWAPALCGCGPQGPTFVEAEGTVTFNGEPVSQASITFVPDEGGVPATGTSDADGHFTLVTQGRSGALLGPHSVSIFAVKDSRKLTPSDFNRMSAAQIDQIRKPVIPIRYFNTQSSELTALVTEDPQANKFEFDLTD